MNSAMQVLSRFFAVSVSLIVVVVLELWYLGRQVTASSAARLSKKKYTTIPEGVVLQPSKLGRTLSRTVTADITGTTAASLSRTASVQRTLSAKAIRSLPATLTGTATTTTTTTTTAPLLTPGYSEDAAIPVSLSSLAAMSQGYSSKSTSTGFGSDSLLVAKIGVVIVVVGALWYFPLWLLLLAGGVMALARYTITRKQQQEQDEGQITLAEIPKLGSFRNSLSGPLKPIEPIPSNSAEGFDTHSFVYSFTIHFLFIIIVISFLLFFFSFFISRSEAGLDFEDEAYFEAGRD
jgi:hypothetical protein